MIFSVHQPLLKHMKKDFENDMSKHVLQRYRRLTPLLLILTACGLLLAQGCKIDLSPKNKSKRRLKKENRIEEREGRMVSGYSEKEEYMVNETKKKWAKEKQKSRRNVFGY